LGEIKQKLGASVLVILKMIPTLQWGAFLPFTTGSHLDHVAARLKDVLVVS
jgi:hypothetical protein